MHSSQFTKRANGYTESHSSDPVDRPKSVMNFHYLNGKKAHGKCTAISANERQLPLHCICISGPRMPISFFGQFLPLNVGLSLQPCKFNLAKGRRVRRKRLKKHDDIRSKVASRKVSGRWRERQKVLRGKWICNGRRVLTHTRKSNIY